MVFLADFLRTEAALGAAGNSGLGIAVPVREDVFDISTPWVDDSNRRHDAADGRLGNRLPARDSGRFRGCFDGYVTDLADRWLRSLSQMSCENRSFLLRTDAHAKGRRRTGRKIRPAVPGIAGRIHGLRRRRLRRLRGRNQYADGLAMKRVCVDGPVFDASTVVW